jgi:hypothetical protein
MVFIAAGPVRAAFEEKPLSARAASLGETGIGDAEAPDTWLSNPAALGFLDRPQIAMTHTRLLGEASLPFSALGVGLPASSGRSGLGAVASEFGDGPYHEREVGLSGAVRATPSAAVGASVGGSFLDMARYGKAGAWTFDAGVLGRPHPRVSVGFAVKRLNNPGLPGVRNALPSITRAGAAVSVCPGARLTLEMVKPRDLPFSARAGLEMSPVPAFFLRAGGESRPGRYSFGFGIQTSFGRIDYAFLSHPFLGDQHQFSLTLLWGMRRPRQP